MTKVVSSLSALFVAPWWVMLAVGTLGWHWSYWQSFLVENAVGVVLFSAIYSAIKVAFTELSKAD